MNINPKYKIGDSVIAELGFFEFFRMPEMYEVIGAYWCDWKYTEGTQKWRYVLKKNKGWRYFVAWEDELELV